MDKEVYEVRLANWRQVIRRCQERPVGTTQKEWLEQNEISESQFYYWLRKVRKEALAEMAVTNGSAAVTPTANGTAAVAEPVTFAEIDLIKMQNGKDSSSPIRPAAVIRFGQLSVELSNNADERLISGILRAVSHAC